MIKLKQKKLVRTNQYQTLPLNLKFVHMKVCETNYIIFAHGTPMKDHSRVMHINSMLLLTFSVFEFELKSMFK